MSETEIDNGLVEILWFRIRRETSKGYSMVRVCCRCSASSDTLSDRAFSPSPATRALNPSCTYRTAGGE